MNTAKLLNLMLCSKGIQQIVDIGFELLGNPIIVADANHKVLAYTKNVVVDDSEWHYIVEKGYVSFCKVTLALKEVFERAKKYPILEDKGASHITFIRKVITAEDQVMAYLTIPGYFRTFDESDLEIAELLSNMLLLEMQRNKFARFAKGSICESFIIELLDGKITNQSIIEKKLNFLKWHPKDYLYVLAVRANQPTGENETISIYNLMEALQELITGSRTVLYNNDVVVVFSCSKEILCLDTKLNNLVKLLGRKQLYAGISRSTRSLLDIPNCYKQSVKAIEIGARMDKNKSIFAYEDYSIGHLLAICAEQENLTNFCHPNLLALAEYDRKNATAFVPSLRTYLEHDKNLAKTAAALHIHRNTMSYRLEKITEVMQLDLRDSNVVLQLFLSFKILEYVKDSNDHDRPFFDRVMVRE